LKPYRSWNVTGLPSPCPALVHIESTPRFRKCSTIRSSVAVPEASSLVALVDEQLPEIVGDAVGAADLVGDHHEPDRRLFGID